MEKEEYINFLKKEIAKTVTETGYPMKHSVLYFIDNGPNEDDKSVLEYNKGTKNLWVSKELTKEVRENFIPDPTSVNNHVYSQCSEFIHECFSEALGLKIKSCIEVNMEELIGF